jgi:threonine/homoserine/homoserine lactone efflux protein
MEGKDIIIWFNMMFPLVFSIGPGNIMFASIGARFGFSKSIPFLMGFDATTLMLSIIIGHGGIKVINEHPLLFGYAKYLGAAYLAYLAYKFFKSSKYIPKDDNNGIACAPSFIDGVILQLLNFKSIVLIVLMYTVFLDGTVEGGGKVFLLSILLLVLAVICHVVWIYSGYWLSKKFESDKFSQIQSYAFSIMLLFVALWMLL